MCVACLNEDDGTSLRIKDIFKVDAQAFCSLTYFTMTVQILPSREELQELYVTPGHPVAFSSPGAIYRYFDGDLPLNDIREALQGIHAYAAHREYKQPHTYNPFYVYQRRTRFQADLIDVLPLRAANRGFGYLLVIIDIFSRKVWVMPLKRKDRFTTAQALRAWLTTLDADSGAWTTDARQQRRQRYLFTDRGREFVNAEVQKLLDEFNVKFNTSKRGLNKAALAERVNKTLQIRIYRGLRHTGRKNYIDTLPHTVDAYNNSKHRSLNYMTPNEADKKSNESKVREINVNRFTKVWKRSASSRSPRNKLKRGNLVLIRVMSKGKVDQRSRAYTPNFSEELYGITAVRRRMPVPMYRLRSFLTGKSVPGSFYANELTKVIPRSFKVDSYTKSKREGGEIWRKVRFVGLHPVFDSWIKSDNIDNNRRVAKEFLTVQPTLGNLVRLVPSTE